MFLVERHCLDRAEAAAEQDKHNKRVERHTHAASGGTPVTLVIEYVFISNLTAPEGAFGVAKYIRQLTTQCVCVYYCRTWYKAVCGGVYSSHGGFLKTAMVRTVGFRGSAHCEPLQFYVSPKSPKMC
jgi:hypothetical protein